MQAVERDDVRAVEVADEARFGQDLLADDLGRLLAAAGQHLERDEPSEQGVARQVHDAVGTATELLLDLQAADLLSRLEHHARIVA